MILFSALQENVIKKRRKKTPSLNDNDADNKKAMTHEFNK